MDFEKDKHPQGVRENPSSLSERLTAVCLAAEELVNSFGAEAAARDAGEAVQAKPPTGLCDVGCDHALVPIMLLKRGIIKTAVGLDVNAGPLERAKENMRTYGISEQALALRLSNGLERLNEGEAQIVVIAGMGGLLIRELLEQRDVRALGVSALVLSPHTKQRELREYLRTNGFYIRAEKEVCDDGKFYPIISVLVEPIRENIAQRSAGHATDGTAASVIGEIQSVTSCTRETALRVCDSFGPLLLKMRDEVLHTYLLKREKELRTVLGHVAASTGASKKTETALEDVVTALQFVEGGLHALQ